MRGIKMSKDNKNDSRSPFLKDFFRDHTSVALTIIICVFLCLCCVFALAFMDKSIELLYQMVSFLLNVMINIIAAAVFFILQVYLPNYRRKKILIRYAGIFLEERLVSRIKMFEHHISMADSADKNEERLLSLLALDCEEIYSAVNECMRTYITVLPDSFIDAANSILYDDMFYMLTLKSTGKLKAVSLVDILEDRAGRDQLTERMNIIEEEAEKVR